MPKYQIKNAKERGLRHGEQIHIPVKRVGKDDGSFFATVVDPGIHFAPIGSDGSTSLPTESGVAHITCSADHATALKEQGFELEEVDEDDPSRPASSAGAAETHVAEVEHKPRDPFETPEDRDLQKQQKLNAKLQAQATAEDQALREAAAEREARIAENRELAAKGEQQASTPPSKESRRKG